MHISQDENRSMLKMKQIIDQEPRLQLLYLSLNEKLLSQAMLEYK